MHIQRAGLQKVAVHGIFHTPVGRSNTKIDDDDDDDDNEHAATSTQHRTGYRVAITARICHSDSRQRVIPHLDEYVGILGPEGHLTLP